MLLNKPLKYQFVSFQGKHLAKKRCLEHFRFKFKVMVTCMTVWKERWLKLRLNLSVLRGHTNLDKRYDTESVMKRLF